MRSQRRNLHQMENVERHCTRPGRIYPPLLPELLFLWALISDFALSKPDAGQGDAATSAFQGAEQSNHHPAVAEKLAAKASKNKESSKLSLLPASTDGRCGAGFGTRCENGCCSAFGWCGGSADWCSCDQGCDERYGRCGQWWKAAVGEHMCKQSTGAVGPLLAQAAAVFPEVSFNLGEFQGGRSSDDATNFREDLFEHHIFQIQSKFPSTSFEKLTDGLRTLAAALPGLKFAEVEDVVAQQSAAFDFVAFAESFRILRTAPFDDLRLGWTWKYLQDFTAQDGQRLAPQVETAVAQSLADFSNLFEQRTNLASVMDGYRDVARYFSDVQDVRQLYTQCAKLKASGFQSAFRDRPEDLIRSLLDARFLADSLRGATQGEPLVQLVDLLSAVKMRGSVNDNLTAAVSHLTWLLQAFPLQETCVPADTARSAAVGVVFQESGEVREDSTAATATANSAADGLDTTRSASKAATKWPQSASTCTTSAGFRDDVTSLLRSFGLHELRELRTEMERFVQGFPKERNFHVVRSEFEKLRGLSTATADPSSATNGNGATDGSLISSLSSLTGPTTTAVALADASGSKSLHPISLTEGVNGVLDFLAAYGDQDCNVDSVPEVPEASGARTSTGEASLSVKKIRDLQGLEPLVTELLKQTGPLLSGRWVSLKELAGDVSLLKKQAIRRYRRLLQLQESEKTNKVEQDFDNGRSLYARRRAEEYNEYLEDMYYEWQTEVVRPRVAQAIGSDADGSTSTSASDQQEQAEQLKLEEELLGPSPPEEERKTFRASKKFVDSHWFRNIADGMRLLTTLKLCYPSESLTDLAQVGYLLGDFAGVTFPKVRGGLDDTSGTTTELAENYPLPAGEQQQQAGATGSQGRRLRESTGSATRKHRVDKMRTASLHIGRELCRLAKSRVGRDDSVKNMLSWGYTDNGLGDHPFSFSEMLQALENLSDYSLEKSADHFFAITAVLRSMIHEVGTTNEALRLSAKIGHLRYQFLQSPAGAAGTSTTQQYYDFYSFGGQAQWGNRGDDLSAVPAAALAGTTTPAPTVTLEQQYGATISLVDSIMTPTDDVVDNEVAVGFQDELEKLQTDHAQDQQAVAETVADFFEDVDAQRSLEQGSSSVGAAKTLSNKEDRDYSSRLDAPFSNYYGDPSAGAATDDGEDQEQDVNVRGGGLSSSGLLMASATAAESQMVPPLREVWTELNSVRRLFWEQDTHLEVLAAWETLRELYPKTDMRSVLDAVEITSRLYFPTEADLIANENEDMEQEELFMDEDAYIFARSNLAPGDNEEEMDGTSENSAGRSSSSSSFLAVLFSEIKNFIFGLLGMSAAAATDAAGASSAQLPLANVVRPRKIDVAAIVNPGDPDAPASAKNSDSRVENDIFEDEESSFASRRKLRPVSETAERDGKTYKLSTALVKPLRELRASGNEVFDTDLVSITSLLTKIKLLARGNTDLNFRAAIRLLVQQFQTFLSDAESLDPEMNAFLHMYVEMQPEATLHYAYRQSRKAWLQAQLEAAQAPQLRKTGANLDDEKLREDMALQATSAIASGGAGGAVEAATPKVSSMLPKMLRDRRAEGDLSAAAGNLMPNFDRSSVTEFENALEQFRRTVTKSNENINLAAIRDCVTQVVRGTVLLSTQVYDLADSSEPVRLVPKRPGNAGTKTSSQQAATSWFAWLCSGWWTKTAAGKNPTAVNAEVASTGAAPASPPTSLYLTKTLLNQLWGPELVLRILSKFVVRFPEEAPLSRIGSAMARLLGMVRDEVDRQKIWSSSNENTMLRRVPTVDPVLLQVVDLDTLVQSIINAGDGKTVSWDAAFRATAEEIRRNPGIFIRARVSETEVGSGRMRLHIKDVVGDTATIVEVEHDPDLDEESLPSGASTASLAAPRRIRRKDSGAAVRTFFWLCLAVILLVTAGAKHLPKQRQRKLLSELFPRSYGTMTGGNVAEKKKSIFSENCGAHAKGNPDESNLSGDQIRHMVAVVWGTVAHVFRKWLVNDKSQQVRAEDYNGRGTTQPLYSYGSCEPDNEEQLTPGGDKHQPRHNSDGCQSTAFDPLESSCSRTTPQTGEELLRTCGSASFLDTMNASNNVAVTEHRLHDSANAEEEAVSSWTAQVCDYGTAIHEALRRAEEPVTAATSANSSACTTDKHECLL
ncbi:unnamed protein product [Amoebophrya sp. A120]|nr:unnamed protein product [Amoebophrya sp. A120]|eukprot:GSA120T00015259001.1